MRKVILFPVLFAVLLCMAGKDAMAYVFENKALLYAGKNGSGYRIHPSLREDLPISDITIYPESDITGGFGISYQEDKALDAGQRESTVVVYTKIPLKP